MNPINKIPNLEKFKRPVLSAIFLIFVVIVIWFFSKNLFDIHVGLNYVIFSFFLFGLWILLTLLDINKEAKSVLAERKTYNNTEGGGEKPMLNWGMLLFRSFILLIIFVLIIYLFSDFMSGTKTPLN